MDRKAELSTLIRSSAPKGLRIASRLVGAADAEDAVQEALARTYPRLGKVENAEAWFLRVLVNHCLSVLRRRRFLRLFQLAKSDEPVEAEPNAAQARRTLEPHLQKLSPMQLSVVQLRYGEEMRIEEIGQALGIGAETVKTHLDRAMARLRQEMRS